MPIVTGRSSTGNVVDISVDEDGKLLTNEKESLTTYRLTDMVTGTTTEYYGYTDKDGNWYIMQLTGTTARYCKGAESYTTNWTNRASLSYDYFYNIF